MLIAVQERFKPGRRNSGDTPAGLGILRMQVPLPGVDASTMLLSCVLNSRLFKDQGDGAMVSKAPCHHKDHAVETAAFETLCAADPRWRSGSSERRALRIRPQARWFPNTPGEQR